jgi:F-type H+-transporting ATPase subunit delta
MKVSKVAQSTARRIFRLCSKDGQVNEEHLKIAVTKLAEEKPRDYRGMLQALRRLLQAELAKKQVTVESAVDLNKAASSKVKKSLCSQYGDDLNFDFKVSPELLGGMRIRVGNDLFDGSVKARLERLQESL